LEIGTNGEINNVITLNGVYLNATEIVVEEEETDAANTMLW